MIFITVGTHEQQFDRLIRAVDHMVREGILRDKVFAQTGYSQYIPQYIESASMISFEDMNRYVEMSDIIITHGGPGSIFLPLQMGKVPIVMPRQYRYGEHVNDHQVDFAKRLSANKKIILAMEEEDLVFAIQHYEEIKGKIDYTAEMSLRQLCQKLTEYTLEIENSAIKRFDRT